MHYVNLFLIFFLSIRFYSLYMQKFFLFLLAIVQVIATTTTVTIAHSIPFHSISHCIHCPLPIPLSIPLSIPFHFPLPIVNKLTSFQSFHNFTLESNISGAPIIFYSKSGSTRERLWPGSIVYLAKKPSRLYIGICASIQKMKLDELFFIRRNRASIQKMKLIEKSFIDIVLQL